MTAVQEEIPGASPDLDRSDMPNFLVIGAAKAGTTALYALLKEHPQVFMSAVKEPRFFSFEGMELDAGRHPVHENTITTLEAYRALFKDAGNALARGEASPSYLHNPRAPLNIRNHLPDIRMIAILRNPVDRAFSHFMHIIKEGYETTTDFETAIDDPEGLAIGDWKPRTGYLSFGFYGDQLRRYYEVFPREQLHVVLYDDFRSDASRVMREIFAFLQVDSNHHPDLERRWNVSGIPRNKRLYRFLKGPNSLRAAFGKLLPAGARTNLRRKMMESTLARPEMTSEARAKMLQLYLDDIELLESLIERDLTQWKSPGRATSA